MQQSPICVSSRSSKLPRWIFLRRLDVHGIPESRLVTLNRRIALPSACESLPVDVVAWPRIILHPSIRKEMKLGRKVGRESRNTVVPRFLSANEVATNPLSVSPRKKSSLSRVGFIFSKALLHCNRPHRADETTCTSTQVDASQQRAITVFKRDCAPHAELVKTTNTM